MTIGIDRRTTLRYLRMQAPMFDGDPDKGGGGGENNDGKGEPDPKPAAKNDDHKGDKGFKPITTQEELDEIFLPRLSRAIKSARKEIKEEMLEEAKAEEAKKNGDYKALYEEAQKVIDGYKAKEAEEELTTLKRKVAAKVGLPETAIPRLSGESEEDLTKDAKELLTLLGPTKKEPEDIDLGNGNRRPRPPKKEGEEEAWKKPEHWLNG